MSTVDISRHFQEKDSVINTDTFERDRFAKLVKKATKMSDLIKGHYHNQPEFPALMGDVWSALYKTKPKMKELEVDTVVPVNYPIMERILGDVEFHEIKKFTILDDLTSVIGTMRISEKIDEWLVEQKDEDEQLKDAMQLYQQEKSNSIDSTASIETTDALREMIENHVQNSGGDLMKRIAAAGKETKETKENLGNLLGGAGDTDEELKKIPLTDQIEFAVKVSADPKIKQIAEWAGKFKAIAQKKQKTKHSDKTNRSGIEIGSDLERMLPQELAMFRHKSTKLDFLRRFSEGQTMVYNHQGRNQLGSGPIVLLLDQSSSMKKIETMSKGFALALAMIAKKQRRDFIMLTFNTDILAVFDFPKGKVQSSDIVELATMGTSGGTRFCPPLQRAMDEITQKPRFKNADIIFVTDGDPSDHHYLETRCVPELNRFKKDKKVQIMSLLIGPDASSKYVEPFSEKVVDAKDFATENAEKVLAI